MAKSTAVIGERPRQIVHRTHGRRHGPISRLMSPSDLGQTLKPFVFLDLFDNEGTSFSGFGLHPHSGIATLTYLLEGSVRYEDTTASPCCVSFGLRVVPRSKSESPSCASSVSMA